MASAIETVVRGGQLEVVEWLHENVEHGCTKKTMDEAARYGWLELVQWLHENRSEGCSTKAMNWAAVNGHLEVVKCLHSNRTEGCTADALTYTAQNGHLDVVKWLHENRREGCSERTLDFAAGSGHWAIVKWWLENRKERYGGHAITQAAANGHMEMVTWLHSNGAGECSTYAMDWAAMGGHLEVVQWLHANRKEGCTRDAMDLAAKEGHLDVVQWLHANRDEGCTVRAIRDAAENGHLLVVQWLYANLDKEHTTVSIYDATSNGQLHVAQWLHSIGLTCTAEDMDNAAKHGHFDMVKWFHANSLEGCTTDAMDGAAGIGHLEMVQWLHMNRSEGCTTRAMDSASKSGHIEVLKWLHAYRTEGCTTESMDQAATNGHLAVVQWLQSNRTEGCTTAAMNGAAANGFLGMLQWLHRNRHEGCTAKAMDKAAENGQFAVVVWLHKNRREGCSVEAIDGAAMRQNWDIVQWLITNLPYQCSSLVLTKAAMDRQLPIVELLYARAEFTTWPRPAHISVLLQMFLSEDLIAHEILGHIVRCRRLRYRSDGMENPPEYTAVDEQEAYFDERYDGHGQYQRFVLKAVDKVCVNLCFADEITKYISTFNVGKPPVLSNRAIHARYGWVYWLLRFSEDPSLDMTLVVEHSSLDAAMFMHNRLQAQNRLHCTKRFAYLMMERGDLASVKWHVLNCSARSVQENLYLAVWVGRVDVVEWMRENWPSLSKLPRTYDKFYQKHWRSSLFHSLDASFEAVEKHFVLEIADLEASLTDNFQRSSHFEPFDTWSVYRLNHTPRSIAMDVAAVGGRLGIVIDYSTITSRNPATCTVTGLCGAICRGHVEVVRFLYQRQPELSVWPRAEDGATVVRRLMTDGHTKMLAFLRQERNMRLESHDLRDAVLQRDLRRLRLICALDLVEISSDATDLAAVQGDIELLVVLQTGVEGLQCSSKALDGAAEEGHLLSVQYLHEHGTPCTRHAMDLAARNGHEDVVRFLFEHRHEGCSPYALYWACINGRVGVVKYLTSKMVQCDIDKCIAAAKTLGNEEIVEVLNAYRASYKAKFDLHRSKRSLARRSTPIQVRKDATNTRIVYGLIRHRMWPDGAPSGA